MQSNLRNLIGDLRAQGFEKSCFLKISLYKKLFRLVVIIPGKKHLYYIFKKQQLQSYTIYMQAQTFHDSNIWPYSLLYENVFNQMRKSWKNFPRDKQTVNLNLLHQWPNKGVLFWVTFNVNGSVSYLVIHWTIRLHVSSEASLLSNIVFNLFALFTFSDSFFNSSDDYLNVHCLKLFENIPPKI